ncbi:ubiquinol oxidase 4 [Pyrus ussuriensis x Pyrus communis]|uniref:Ubiquinol oxidase n=1 Tax=Pyrus ussuriensis x Pyrus communis TaxID=2448454 RepID=A0A5N5IDB5_9ROSA|nr:ubiquinol oxidase 4 [Pyrus ussuriensis x Pyrus communis]
MAAAILSSPVFAISASSSSSSSSSLRARRSFKTSAFSSRNRFPYNPISARPSISRVRATMLQEDEEKVVVEESLEFKASTFDELKASSGNLSESSSSSDTVIKVLDTVYCDRDCARFFVLQTIARVPYFAFMSVLHMYESFGWWRRSDYLKVHFAESWNGMHHLLIMEELGGNAWWFDRFLAQHIANYPASLNVCLFILFNASADHFSERVESHAYSTYDKFIKARGEDLKKMPAPEVAVKYYTSGDMYLFGKLCLFFSLCLCPEG